MANNNFAHIMFTGNLTKDPSIAERTVPSTGEIMKVANFTVACNYTRRNGEQAVTYYKVALWGQDAEQAVALKKGNLVKIRATAINQQAWTGRDGVERIDNIVTGKTLVDRWDNNSRAWAAITGPAPQAVAEAAHVAESKPTRNPRTRKAA